MHNPFCGTGPLFRPGPAYSFPFEYLQIQGYGVTHVIIVACYHISVPKWSQYISLASRLSIIHYISVPEWLSIIQYISVPEWLSIIQYISVPEWLSIIQYNSVPEWLSIIQYNSVPEWLSIIEYIYSVPEWLGIIITIACQNGSVS